MPAIIHPVPTFTTTPSSSRSKRRAGRSPTIFPPGHGSAAATKKADFRAVNKLAGDTLAQKSKDIRLASWYLESSIRLEGFSVLAPAIETLRALQQGFWETLHPMIEDGGDLEFRAMSAETATRQIADAAYKIPLTKNGWSYEVYQDSRMVGYEKDASTKEKKEAREEAINQAGFRRRISTRRLPVRRRAYIWMPMRG